MSLCGLNTVLKDSRIKSNVVFLNKFVIINEVVHNKLGSDSGQVNRIKRESDYSVNIS